MNSIDRFSDRVNNYEQYRPRYPDIVLDYIKDRYTISKDTVIADIGAGTGIFTELLIKLKCNLIAIEPNNEMRAVLQNKFSNEIKTKDTTAENTSLLNNSVDGICVAQAFHWFNTEKVLFEFSRILKQNGWILLIWNSQSHESEFMKAYEELLLKYCDDFAEVRNTSTDKEEELSKFLSHGTDEKIILSNDYEYNFDQLLGRFSSSSYTPTDDHENYQSSRVALKQLFEQYQSEGYIIFQYKLTMYFFQLTKYTH